MNIMKSLITPVYTKKNIFLRKNQSFVIRRRKITDSQLIFIKNYWLTFCLNFQSHPLDFKTVFDINYPIVLEIGFGSGNSLVQMAINNPNLNFIGIEVYLSGIVSCLKLVKNLKLKNIKFIYHDAVEVIYNMIFPNTIFKIQLFFPDPWNKKKHHKRRIFTKSFIKLINEKLVNFGILHVVTDSKSYADSIIKTIKELNEKNNLRLITKSVNKPFSRTITKYENRGIKLGHSIFDLIFKKVI